MACADLGSVTSRVNMTLRYEPFSAEVRDDPYPHYAELRRQAPVYWADEAKAWCLARYEDVQFALRHAELFSSDAMRSMLIGAKPGADPATDPAMMDQVLALARAFPYSLEE